MNDGSDTKQSQLIAVTTGRWVGETLALVTSSEVLNPHVSTKPKISRLTPGPQIDLPPFLNRVRSCPRMHSDSFLSSDRSWTRTRRRGLRLTMLYVSRYTDTNTYVHILTYIGTHACTRKQLYRHICIYVYIEGLELRVPQEAPKESSSDVDS